MNKLSRLAAGAMVAILVATGCVVAAFALATGNSRSHVAAAANVSPPHRNIAAGLIRNFQVFRRSQARESAVDASAFSINTEPLLASLGLDPGAAAAVPTSVGTITVVPGAAGVCLLMPDPTSAPAMGLNCATTATAESGQFAGVSVAPSGQETIYGLVPDPNTAVTVQPSSGPRLTAQVTDGVFAITVPHGSAQVLSRAAGGQSTTTQLPLGGN